MDKFSLRLRDATLTLKSGTLQDYKTTGGSIQVDGSAGTGSTLELQTTTINGNDLGSLNVDGLLEADNATANTVENFSAGDFTSDGKILVTGNATLTLLERSWADWRGAKSNAQARRSQDRPVRDFEPELGGVLVPSVMPRAAGNPAETWMADRHTQC